MIQRSILLGAVATLALACAEPRAQNTDVRTPQTPQPTGTGVLPNPVEANVVGAPDLGPETVQAEFISAPGAGISGQARLVEREEGVKIHIDVAGAAPGAKGIHIQQTDNCSDIPNKSMGSHFSPEEAQHGLPSAAHHHLGDLGNINIGNDGKGELDITVPHANLRATHPLSFVGRSIVLHEGSDNGTGESGDSGHPVACAPIHAP